MVATEQSSALASDWFAFLIAGLAVALLVAALIVFAMVRFRRRDDAMPRQFRTNTPLEIGWTIAPLVLVGALFVVSYRVEARVDTVSAHPDLTVRVNGYRWGWTFAYDGGPTVGGASDGPVLGKTAGPPPQLVLPLGETTRIELTSSDVNHAFWVPDFLFKRDAIPGTTNTFDLRPDKLGTFVGHCAQFCGFDHALMSFSVRVLAPDAFAAWRRTAQAS